MTIFRYLSAVALALLFSAPSLRAEGGKTPTDVLQAAARGAETSKGADMLLGLRRLKDPALRPLYSALAAGETPGQRKHGVLGLAELESPPRINPLLISRLNDPAEQANILAEAIAQDMVGLEQVEQMLAWPQLEPLTELVLRARLAREGRPIDRARVQSLLGNRGLPTEVLAAILLAQSGEPAPLDTAAGKLLAQSDPERSVVVGMLLDIIRRERMTGASPMLARLEAVFATNGSAHADVLRTWIRVAPNDGLLAWQRAWDRARGLPDQLRLALVALDASDIAPPALFKSIKDAKGDAILSLMGQLGEALASKTAPTLPLTDLLRLRYRPAELWVVQNPDRFTEADAEEAARVVISAWAARSSTLDPLSSAIVPAVERLAEKDRAFLVSALNKACDRTDEGMAHAIVLGFLTSGKTPIWDPQNPPRWPDGQTACMALLVDAGHAEPGKYPASRLTELDAIASGIPILLPPAMRTQAAWYAVKLRGQADATLARLLAPEED